ncbi:LysM peptidoglycan-binding domain-containing protein [Ornithinimicrobium ciconiae]|uniref:LysM peptidoglycan-binding domain-containing protein n=1 Tax=Ornithinimicrobium ciconiae TaxID=2594265 RepID=A0A516GCH1_9MICO|nr:LysM domain-containing protein [Ornithinimicrobium ciconiae]QDO89225.1 LysM peptidoglycan-binding domain-containing protein [Ornithinimicrobium ciconiae]
MTDKDLATAGGGGRSTHLDGVRHPGVGICASALGAAGAAVLSLIVLTCWNRARHGWATAVGPDGIVVAHGLELLALAVAGLVGAWLAALLLVGAAAALPGRSTAPLRSLAERLAPRLARHVAAGLVTAAVTLTPLGAAQASTAPISTAPTSTVPTTTAPTPTNTSAVPASQSSAGVLIYHAQEPDPANRAPEPGWRPTAPAPTPDPDSISLVSRGAAKPDAVVVRAGDTLWDIAARHLGEDADAAAIAEAWPHWYDANRALIGSDPDLLLPGTRLVPPVVDSYQEVAP